MLDVYVCPIYPESAVTQKLDAHPQQADGVGAVLDVVAETLDISTMLLAYAPGYVPQVVVAPSKLPISLNSSQIADEASGEGNNERITYADGALQAPRQTKLLLASATKLLRPRIQKVWDRELAGGIDPAPRWKRT